MRSGICGQALPFPHTVFDWRFQAAEGALCVCVCVCVCLCTHTHTHTNTHTHTHVTGGVSRKPHARGRGTPVHSAGHPNRNNLGRSSQVENLFVCARLFSLNVCVHMCVCACASVCECVCNIYV